MNTGREVYRKQPCLLSQIRFAAGTNSATVNQSIVRGSRDIYLLRANQGQRMAMKITSLENNAVFDVIAPNGEILKTEATQSSLKLLATGNYEIIVGGNSGRGCGVRASQLGLTKGSQHSNPIVIKQIR